MTFEQVSTLNNLKTLRIISIRNLSSFHFLVNKIGFLLKIFNTCFESVVLFCWERFAFEHKVKFEQAFYLVKLNLTKQMAIHLEINFNYNFCFFQKGSCGDLESGGYLSTQWSLLIGLKWSIANFRSVVRSVCSL